MKVTKSGSRDRVQYAKRKFKQIREASEELVAECIDVPTEAFASTSAEPKECSKAEADIEYLVGAIKQKLTVSNRQQQIVLLTLAKSWTKEKIASEFNVTETWYARHENCKKKRVFCLLYLLVVVNLWHQK